MSSFVTDGMEGSFIISLKNYTILEFNLAALSYAVAQQCDFFAYFLLSEKFRECLKLYVAACLFVLQSGAINAPCYVAWTIYLTVLQLLYCAQIVNSVYDHGELTVSAPNYRLNELYVWENLI